MKTLIWKILLDSSEKGICGPENVAEKQRAHKHVPGLLSYFYSYPLGAHFALEGHNSRGICGCMCVCICGVVWHVCRSLVWHVVCLMWCGWWCVYSMCLVVCMVCLLCLVWCCMLWNGMNVLQCVLFMCVAF